MINIVCYCPRCGYFLKSEVQKNIGDHVCLQCGELMEVYVAPRSVNGYQWRVGRKLGRTIYAQVGDGPSDEDTFLGLMETGRLAALVIDAVNYAREYGNG